MVDDRLHHLQREFHRNRETNALRAARLGDDRGVDADQVALGIHQCAAGVAAVDRCVGLDEVFIGVQAQLVAAGGADDAHGDRLADAERVADRQRNVADAYAVRMADGDGRQVRQVDLQYGEVGFRVAADYPSQRFPPILERHYDLLGVRRYMVVGQQIAFRAHDHR